MKRLFLLLSIFTVLLVALVGIMKFQSEAVSKRNSGISQEQEPKWESVKRVFNKGSIQNDVFRVTFPRSDLQIKVDHVQIDPNLALTSYLAFKQVGNHSMMMGDLVLLEKEVKPVETKLAELGIEITALHNHIIEENPKIMYLHVAGHGDPVNLAEKMKVALSLTGTPLASTPPEKSPSTFNWSKVEDIIGWKGVQRGKVFQFSIPRPEKITEKGVGIPPAMGIAMPINFQLIGEKAATTGDFVLLSNEVNPVVRELTKNGITVTAIHNHMLNESPRLFFLHFWGVDEPEKLARGLRAALNQTTVGTQIK
ncbi:peptidoglycan-binding protein LysM [Brevibacillus laterosporus]|uniref:DUF1259 domain-containing protein n=1 Tax=Brevibacillus laterosporus TaxID=1465 RepID=UPI000C76449F|nr:DUF1259 domain-containing protein [Brevibacillus laterosporus]AUM65774.1 peptidoglycan-binding protein LysM [Brevibacillus laterosporus]